MANKNISDIFSLCTEIEKLAAETYTRFAELSEDHAKRQKIWHVMADEEIVHQKYWESLLVAGAPHEVLHSFENFDEVYHEVDDTKNRISLLSEKYSCADTKCETADMLATALAIESSLTSRAFANLFNIKVRGESNKTLGEGYALHLHHLLELMSDEPEDYTQTYLVCQSIIKLWNENQVIKETYVKDSLTGIATRGHFFDLAGQWVNWAVRGQHCLGLLMIDVDGLKKINDVYGHQQGDKVLELIGWCLENSTRSSDILGRYGGDEFIVLVPEAGKRGIIRMSEKLQQCIKELSHEDLRPEIIPSVSIGFSVNKHNRPDDKKTFLPSLINKADQMLYQVKHGT